MRLLDFVLWLALILLSIGLNLLTGADEGSLHSSILSLILYYSIKAANK